jgi:cytochrome b
MVLGTHMKAPAQGAGAPFSEQIFALHDLLGAAIAGLVAAHIAAALFHHFVRRDGILLRMISGGHEAGAPVTAGPDRNFTKLVNNSIMMTARE